MPTNIIYVQERDVPACEILKMEAKSPPQLFQTLRNSLGREDLT